MFPLPHIEAGLEASHEEAFLKGVIDLFGTFCYWTHPDPSSVKDGYSIQGGIRSPSGIAPAVRIRVRSSGPGPLKADLTFVPGYVSLEDQPLASDFIQGFKHTVETYGGNFEWNPEREALKP